MECPCALHLHYKAETSSWPAEFKIFTVCPLQKKSADPCSMLWTKNCSSNRNLRYTENSNDMQKGHDKMCLFIKRWHEVCFFAFNWETVPDNPGIKNNQIKITAGFFFFFLINNFLLPDHLSVSCHHNPCHFQMFYRKCPITCKDILHDNNTVSNETR